MIDQTSRVAERPVHVAFVPTVDDQVRATQALARPMRVRWRREALITAVAGVAAVIIVRNGQTGLFVGGSKVVMVVSCVVLVGLLLGRQALLRWVLARYRGRNPELYAPVEYTFGLDGLRAESAMQKTDVPWASFVLVHETKDLFLFQLSSSTGYFVPRRALREGDERRLRDMLAARLGPRAAFTNDQTGR